MNKNYRLKKYFVTITFYFEVYDYAFNVWAYNKIEAKQLVVNYLKYHKHYNICDYTHIEVTSCPFTTIIDRLTKKVPDTPTCEQI